MSDKLFEWASIDARSLAVFRVLLAILLLVDLSVRLPWVDAFLTDAGILPRYLLPNLYSWAPMWSLHSLSGDAPLQYALFAAAAVAAVMLGLGWQTRLATVASWVLLTSLHNRNITVLNTGDDLLRTLLFWSMLLPLGACWSLDARNRDEPAPRAILHPAGPLLMLQVILVYWVVVVRRHGQPEWFEAGSAVWYALMIEGYTTEIGIFVRDRLPWLLTPLTWTAMAIETFAPLLCFSPWKTGPMRMLGLSLFLAMHISFGLMMEIGLFWAVSCTSWVIFVPPWLWDRVQERVAAVELSGPVDRRAPALATFVAVVAMILALHSNFESLERKHGIHVDSISRPLVWAERLVRMKQGWNVYSPPGRADHWFVPAGTLADGRVVDLRTGASPPSFDPPEDIGDSYENQRWRRVLFHMGGPRRAPMYDTYAWWAARDWEERHPGDQVQQVKLHILSRRTLRRKRGPTQERLLKTVDTRPDG